MINHLLQVARLPRRELDHLIERCEPCTLEMSQVLSQPGDPVRHVYFPLDSVMGLTFGSPGGIHVQIGMVGCEGMLGVPLVLGAKRHQWRAEVLGGGHALRMSAGAFRDEAARRPALAATLHRYIGVRMVQLATTSWCARFHEVEPRLARWLLMFQDRKGTNHFEATQSQLGTRLGVRRASVTLAAIALQRAGLIAYRRGAVQVLDRAGLEGAACSCYAADNAAYVNGLT